ncbi:UDP binding domain-containing protein [Streptomyces sp. NPDC048560]|uniref:UDP binding domain-containing protein n=1 Tax=Streptomyces sp. NPDC048560 TaxID=3155488 RepID=UPI003423E45A
MTLSNTSPLHQSVCDRSARITIWGAGFIGLSAATAFAQQGFRCAIVDVDSSRVRCINAGIVPLPGFEDRVQLDPQTLRDGRLRAVPPDDKDALDAQIHLICVNTDRGGKAFQDPLQAVIKTIGSAHRADRELLVSIESTVSVRWLDQVLPLLTGATGVVETGIHLATAPRRDWLLDPEMNLRSLPRVVGTLSPASQPLVTELYGTVSDVVHVASDWTRAALSKSVENLYRYVDLVLTNQLAAAYPDLDMAEVFRLAGTKWNVPTLHPSIGIGGYCIPLSPHYAGDGLLGEGQLPLVDSALDWDAAHPSRVAEWLTNKFDGPIGILGISYAPDVHVPQGSPTLALAAALSAHGADVRLHDPFLSTEEVIARGEGARALSWPEDLAAVRTLVIATPHTVYADLPDHLSALADPPTVIDSLGKLREAFAGTKVRYVEIGTPALWAEHNPVLGNGSSVSDATR